MAFEIAKFNTGMQMGLRGKTPVLHSYKSTADTLATMLQTTANYFGKVGTEPNLIAVLSEGDVMRVEGTDGVMFARVSDIDGTTVIMFAESSVYTSGQIKSSADLSLVYGLNLLDNASGVNSAYNLPAPPLIVGGEVTVVLRGLSTTVTVIDNSTAATIGTGNTITLLQAARTAKLRAVSTSRWDVIEGVAALT